MITSFIIHHLGCQATNMFWGHLSEMLLYRASEATTFVNTWRLPITNRGKPASDRFRLTNHPGADRFRQHCDDFILQWIGWLERMVVRWTWRKSRHFQNGERVTAAL